MSDTGAPGVVPDTRRATGACLKAVTGFLRLLGEFLGAVTQTLGSLEAENIGICFLETGVGP